MKHREGTLVGDAGIALFHQAWLPEGSPRALLVLVHGFGEHTGRYTHLVEHFVPRGIGIYGYDLRGHGRSPGKRGLLLSWDEYRNDLGAAVGLVRAEHSQAPLFLYGHSMGGQIALEYALHKPEGLRGVIASAPTLGPPGVSPILLALSRVLSVVTPRLTLNAGLDATALSRDPDIARAYVEDPLVHGLASARLGTELMDKAAWLQANAAAFKAPLLILHGAADRLSPPEDSRRFFENAGSADKTRLEYPQGFHEPHNDIEYSRVMSDVEAWLEARLG